MLHPAVEQADAHPARRPLFTIFDFPLTGALAGSMMQFADALPAPWRAHALRTVGCTLLSAAQQCLVAADDPAHGLSVSVWVSLPDLSILARTAKPGAYIHHVYVAPEMRRRRLALSACAAACRVAVAADAHRVLLCTADTALRDGLYGALGFRAVPNDPFLMELPLSDAHGLSQSEAIPQIRIVTPFDLATVQSICAGDHWFGGVADWERVRSQEVEEEFCDLFNDPSAGSETSYLAAGTLNGNHFVCWFRRHEPLWQRVSFEVEGSSAADAKRAGQMALEASELVKTPSVPSRVAVAQLLTCR